MDTSETYIKMRLTVIPDLGIGKIPLQPYHFVKGIPDLSKQVVVDRKGDWYHITLNEGSQIDICQLERQDQLQWMLIDKMDEDVLPDVITKILGYFNDFALCVCPSFASYEQLWLAFVMKEYFNKIWIQDEWRIVK